MPGIRYHMHSELYIQSAVGCSPKSRSSALSQFFKEKYCKWHQPHFTCCKLRLRFLSNQWRSRSSKIGFIISMSPFAGTLILDILNVRWLPDWKSITFRTPLFKQIFVVTHVEKARRRGCTSKERGTRLILCTKKSYARRCLQRLYQSCLGLMYSVLI